MKCHLDGFFFVEANEVENISEYTGGWRRGGITFGRYSKKFHLGQK